MLNIVHGPICWHWKFTTDNDKEIEQIAVELEISILLMSVLWTEVTALCFTAKAWFCGIYFKKWLPALLYFPTREQKIIQDKAMSLIFHLSPTSSHYTVSEVRE